MAKLNRNLLGGYLPPQAIELEEVVLGALLQDKEAMIEVAEILKAESFYHEANRVIYLAILKLSMAGDPVDILTVTQALRAEGKLEQVGGPVYVTKLTNRVASAANIEKHCRIIQECYIKRELIRTSSETISECYDETSDVFDILGKSSFEKDGLLQSVTKQKEVTNDELFRETISVMSAKKEFSGITGVPSGFKEVDRITAGWQKSDLIIIAGRPGMGKTAWALQNALNASFDHDVPGAIFSLEMSKVQLMYRQISIVCEIPLEKFRKNSLTEFDWNAIHRMTAKIANAPIHWDDTSSLTIMEFRAKARRLKARYDIQYIIIDYLQLMNGKTGEKGGNREQEIGMISRTLKSVAKELNIPVLALSQLSRAVESRPGHGKRPMLSDLRESGSIEQDADVVIFLYRPEYYGITEDEEGNDLTGIGEVIIAKHRNGETDDVPLKFNKSTTGFSNLEFSYSDATYLVHSEPPNQWSGIQPNNNFDTNQSTPIF